MSYLVRSCSRPAVRTRHSGSLRAHSRSLPSGRCRYSVSVARRRRRETGRPRYAPTVSSGRSGTGPTRAFLDSPRRRGLSRHGRSTARPWRSRSGFRPDRDDAAARVAADELPRRFGRTAVDLDSLDVLGRRVACEVRRRLVAVEEVLRVAPRRRADHRGDAVVRAAHLLYATDGHEHIAERRWVDALDLLFGEEIAHPGVTASLEVREPSPNRARLRLDDDPGQLVGRVQLEDVLESFPIVEVDPPGARRVPDRGNLERVAAGLTRQLETPSRVHTDGIASLDDDAGARYRLPGHARHDLPVEHPSAAVLRRRHLRGAEAESYEPPRGCPLRAEEGVGVHRVLGCLPKVSPCHYCRKRRPAGPAAGLGAILRPSC